MHVNKFPYQNDYKFFLRIEVNSKNYHQFLVLSCSNYCQNYKVDISANISCILTSFVNSGWNDVASILFSFTATGLSSSTVANISTFLPTSVTIGALMKIACSGGPSIPFTERFVSNNFYIICTHQAHSKKWGVRVLMNFCSK